MKEKIKEPDEKQIIKKLRTRFPLRLQPEGLKIAAVLVPLLMKDGFWQVLLTRRTNRVEHHKGEISFPGGHRDAEDTDLLATALREAREEVGIRRKDVKILGRLDDITTITGFRVRPFVGSIKYPFEMKICELEIDEVIVLPLHEFLEPENFMKRVISRAGQDYPVYFFTVRDYTVWGATAKILKQFLEITMGFKES